VRQRLALEDVIRFTDECFLEEALWTVRSIVVSQTRDPPAAGIEFASSALGRWLLDPPLSCSLPQPPDRPQWLVSSSLASSRSVPMVTE
jgi:hypothetical protein